jgi:hypothetical protein
MGRGAMGRGRPCVTGSGRLGRWIVVLAGWAVAGAGWAVAVAAAPAVGAGGGGGPVGVQAQGPAPAVDDDQVVEGAQRHQVGQRGRATLRPRDQVMNLAATRWLVTAGEGAVRVAGGGGAAQVRRDDRLVGCPPRPGTILAAISRRHASSSASWRR